MASETESFDASLGCLVRSFLDRLAAQIAEIGGLTLEDRDAIIRATEESLVTALHAKLSRLLLVELNSARVEGRLNGPEPSARWREFLRISSSTAFWDGLAPHYPSLHARIERLCQNRCDASLLFAERWAGDGRELGRLTASGEELPDTLGSLANVEFGAGDSHRGGLTVAIVQTKRARLVYKPRPLAIDDALARFVDALVGHGLRTTIGAPAVIDRGGYGWAEFVHHRYVESMSDLSLYYRGIGHWLAIMRVLRGSDLHAENIIAAGARPIIVDCETLFTPKVTPHGSELGAATDIAVGLVSGGVLDVGLLPGRGRGLGWRGVDNSGVGGLLGQQPKVVQPVIKKAGTDEAHMGEELVDAPVALNHPTPTASLAEHWPSVLAGFDEATALLQQLDASGELEPLLAPFDSCEVRVVPRATEVYAELARMLWHPVSLHDEEAARERARSLLAKMAANVAAAPHEGEIICAEIDALVHGDIPFFSAVVGEGALIGPAGVRWRQHGNLKRAALADWRAADFERERNYIRASLVSAYARDGWMPDDVSRFPSEPALGDIDKRRRRQAAFIMSQILGTAIRGEDGTAQWVAPVLTPTGWSVQPLDHDLYGGIYGVALVVAAYLRETAAGRADPVAGLEELLGDLLHTLDLAEQKLFKRHSSGDPMRPPAPGGYLGLGSQIWARLALARLRVEEDESLARAARLALVVDRTCEADTINDVVTGCAGAIPPLLQLWRRTTNAAYLEMAMRIGDRLIDRAHWTGDAAHWRHDLWPNGLGGFAHGASGVGWALSKLAAASAAGRYADVARAAFTFEDSLYDETEGNWLDLRLLAELRSAAAWCHGSVGIGLARLDLDPQAGELETQRVVERAARATWKLGFGWNHCACHGDAGAMELMQEAIALGAGPAGVTQETVLASVLTSIEQHGVLCGVTAAAFAPSLLPGVGGVAYQLLRSHPDSDLPSILTLEGEPL